MSILQLLSHKNPQNHIQAIQFLAKSGSPYAIELLKIVAQRAQDEKMREFSKKAATHIRKELITEDHEQKGKRKRLTDLSIHVEILMAIAALSLDDMMSPSSKRIVARAYAFDMDLLNDDSYSHIAEQVFHNRVQSLEDEVQDFVRQEVKNHRTLKSNYPFFMYLIDVPVAMTVGGAILAAPNVDNIRRFLEYQWETNNFIDWNMLQVILFVLVCLVVGRVFHIIFEQWQAKQISGWEKEARHLAIEHLEGEIKKIVKAAK